MNVGEVWFFLRISRPPLLFTIVREARWLSCGAPGGCLQVPGSNSRLPLLTADRQFPDGVGCCLGYGMLKEIYD